MRGDKAYFLRRELSLGWMCGCLGVMGLSATILWYLPGAQVAVWVMGVAALVGVMLTPLKRVRVDALGVEVTRLTLVGLFTRSEICPIENVRRVRYRSDLYTTTGSMDRDELRFFLDVITRDGRILNLRTSVTFPPERDAGQRLARALGVEYEEFLDVGSRPLA